MRKTKEKHPAPVPGDAIFALDIGTRSIIGMVGVKENGKVRITAIEKAEHSRRAMVDGQIEDINRVAEVASQVKTKLEERLGLRLNRVCVAAAGRALKTQRAAYEMELPEERVIGEELISQLETGAISKAEETFEESLGKNGSRQRFYLVGYTVCQYYLDDYLIANLRDHRGRKLKAELIATFLPSEVVGSLYATMNKIGLEVASLTLEPIAAINAAIPDNLRLLNLVLVDIGAGTSDIAACRDGSIIGYTMATIAGDEVTETIMREYLVDFQTAERMKMDLESQDEIHFTDVLGLEQTVSRENLTGCIADTSTRMVKEICEKILEVNGGPPSALFLAGGGSRLTGLKDRITECLGLDPRRVAIAGNNFQINACSDNCDIANPEYATPLGIAVSAGLNLINDSFLVTLNGNPAKLFRNGAFNTRDILMMNGYGYQDMVGRSGQNLVITVNGRRTVFYGTQPEPAVLRINEKEGKLSDTIHAGDSITFVPARHGNPAQALVKDIQNLPASVKVKVNGKVVARSTPLKNGDSVSFSDGFPNGGITNEDSGHEAPRYEENNSSRELDKTIEEAAGQKGKPNSPPASLQDDISDISDVSVTRLDHLPAKAAAVKRDKKPSKTTTAWPEDIPAKATPDHRYDMPTETASIWHSDNPSVEVTSQRDDNLPGKDAPLKDEHSDDMDTGAVKLGDAPEPGHIPEAAVNTIAFRLNGSRVTLPVKSDRTPYYLMDMLQLSGIDFKNISGNVVLKVNGIPGYFQQALRVDDEISIYEEKP